MRKGGKFGRGVLIAAGLVFLCAAIYFLVYDVYAYCRQFEQKDWPTATATVIHVEARREGRRGHYHTRYDIYYQYEAAGDLYSGAIYGLNAARQYGESFSVKYDPSAPSDSTHYLEPEFGLLVSGVLGFAVFGLAGGHMVRSAWRRGGKGGARRQA